MPGKIQVKYGLDNYEVISYSFILNQLYRIATQCKNPVQEHIDRFPFVDICFLKASSGVFEASSADGLPPMRKETFMCVPPGQIKW